MQKLHVRPNPKEPTSVQCGPEPQSGRSGRPARRRSRPPCAAGWAERLRAAPRRNDQRDQPPLYIDVATFGRGADACAQHLAKGRQVAVTGRLIYQQWETKDGSKRSKHQVIGNVSFGGRPPDKEAARDE